MAPETPTRVTIVAMGHGARDWATSYHAGKDDQARRWAKTFGKVAEGNGYGEFLEVGAMRRCLASEFERGWSTGGRINFK